jgi:hypothetical protein
MIWYIELQLGSHPVARITQKYLEQHKKYIEQHIQYIEQHKN